MTRNIRWSKTARQSYLDLLLYLQEEWGGEKALELDKKLQTILNTISLRCLISILLLKRHQIKIFVDVC